MTNLSLFDLLESQEESAAVLPDSPAPPAGPTSLVLPAGGLLEPQEPKRSPAPPPMHIYKGTKIPISPEELERIGEFYATSDLCNPKKRVRVCHTAGGDYLIVARCIDPWSDLPAETVLGQSVRPLAEGDGDVPTYNEHFGKHPGWQYKFNVGTPKEPVWWVTTADRVTFYPGVPEEPTQPATSAEPADDAPTEAIRHSDEFDPDQWRLRCLGLTPLTIALSATELAEVAEYCCPDKICAKKPVKPCVVNGRNYLITGRYGSDIVEGHEVRPWTPEDTDTAEYPGPLDADRSYRRMKFKVGKEWWVVSGEKTAFHLPGMDTTLLFHFDDVEPRRDFWMVYRLNRLKAEDPELQVCWMTMAKYAGYKAEHGLPQAARWSYRQTPGAVICCAKPEGADAPEPK